MSAQNINEQYARRIDTERIYSGIYSIKASEEKTNTLRKLLADHNPGVAGKTVLEIGAGQGHNVEMLLHCGFMRENIFLNELLPERIEELKRNFAPSQIYPGDALAVNFNKQFDLILQSTVFTSVLDDTTRQQLAQKMWELLKPGGQIIWYDFIFNNPRNKDVRKVPLSEVKALFPAATDVISRKVTLAPPLGRKVGKFYHWFNWSILRSHILVLIKK